MQSFGHVTGNGIKGDEGLPSVLFYMFIHLWSSLNMCSHIRVSVLIGKSHSLDVCDACSLTYPSALIYTGGLVVCSSTQLKIWKQLQIC